MQRRPATQQIDTELHNTLIRIALKITPTTLYQSVTSRAIPRRGDRACRACLESNRATFATQCVQQVFASHISIQSNSLRIGTLSATYHLQRLTGMHQVAKIAYLPNLEYASQGFSRDLGSVAANFDHGGMRTQCYKRSCREADF